MNRLTNFAAIVFGLIAVAAHYEGRADHSASRPSEAFHERGNL